MWSISHQFPFVTLYTYYSLPSDTICHTTLYHIFSSWQEIWPRTKMSWKMSCLASRIVCLWLEGFVKTLENSLLTSELLYIEGRNLQNLFLESSPQLQYVIYWAPTSDFWNVREFIDPNSSPYVHKRIFALRDRHLINMHMKEFRQCFFLYQPRFQNIRTSQIPFCTHLTKDLSGDILLKATYNYSGICFLDKQRRKEKQINCRQCFWVPN